VARAAHRIVGLQWEQVTDSAVKLCVCGGGDGAAADAPSRVAVLFAELVRAAPVNERFAQRYVVHGTVLAFSCARAGMHLGKALDLSAKVTSGLLNLEREVAAATPPVVDARLAVLRRLVEGCPSLADARLDCINRPKATHRYDRKGGHEPTPQQPRQARRVSHTNHATLCPHLMRR